MYLPGMGWRRIWNWFENGNLEFKSILLILSLCILSYGLRLNRLGLYEIDWYHFLLANQGLDVLFRVAGQDRLLAGLPIALEYLIFRNQLVFWHGTVIALHAGNALLFFAILNRLLPGRTLFNTLTVSLFVVYPAVESLFTTGQIHSLSSLFLTISSIYLVVRAIDGKQVKWLFIACALVLGLIALLIYELPLGLMLANILVLWVLSGHSPDTNRRERLLWVGRIGLPFILMMVAFLIWRLVLYPALASDSRQVPLGSVSILEIGFKILRNYFILLFYSWQAPLTRLMDAQAFWIVWLPWAMAGLAGILTFAWVLLAQRDSTRNSQELVNMNQSHRSDERWLIPVGFILTGLGFASFLFTPYAIPLPNNLFSRVDIAATPGAAFTLVAIAMTIARTIAIRWAVLGGLLIAALVGLATGSNFIVQEQFVREWQAQQDMWKELVWRAPRLKPGTFLFLTGPREQNALGRPFDDFEISSVLAFAYQGQDIRGEQITDSTLTRLEFDGFSPQFVSFKVPLDQILVAQYGAGCLKIIDANFASSESDDPFLNAVGHLSNPGTIVSLTDASVSQLDFLLGETKNESWCHAYEQAELLRSQGQWEKIVQRLDVAEQFGQQPESPSEWLPFIEALNRTGDYTRAGKLAFKVRMSKSVHAMKALAAMLMALQSEAAENGDTHFASQIQPQLNLLR